VPFSPLAVAALARGGVLATLTLAIVVLSVRPELVFEG
jgi:hypothetical protein